jgi:hypothetical protein
MSYGVSRKVATEISFIKSAVKTGENTKESELQHNNTIKIVVLN